MVPNLPSSQTGVLDNSEDDIYEEKEDSRDPTYSPDSDDDSLKSSETWSEQSMETEHVRVKYV